MDHKKILITGSLGKQGKATILALLNSPPKDSPYKILALTRNAQSPAALSLAQNSSIEVIEGDLSDCDSIFEKAGGEGAIWGVFLYTVPDMKSKNPAQAELSMGMNMVDAAVKYGVKRVVFSSVDRGGVKSEGTSTEIPHFVSKHNIELHLKDKFQNTGIIWTILRPTVFMDNLTPTFFGRVFAAMWMNLGTTKLQFVSTTDIGVFAALAFTDSDTNRFNNNAIGLAGDELTYEEANEVFWRVYGRPMPRSYGFVGAMVQSLVKEVGTMFAWFESDGYGADVGECRRLNPEMMDLESFFKKEAKFLR